MDYLEGGRLGRITKNLRKLGFEKEMEKILFDSSSFPNLKKIEQTKYVETVIDRMEFTIGLTNAKKVLFECGTKCCGKSWSNFVKQIWDDSESIEEFFTNINKAEEKYNTTFSYNSKKKIITVIRTKCICGLINKGEPFLNNKTFCHCSIGHMNAFFNSIFKVKDIHMKKSIFSGDERCEWKIKLAE